MPFSVQFIRKLEGVGPELREVILALLEEVERQREESVTRKEFLEFAKQTEENFREVWQAIKELAESHKRAEERLTKLEKTVAELAEAQRKADERLTNLENTVAELAEAQKKTEQRLNELAEAQKKTEQRLNELAEAQKRTEKRLNELAEAQKKTEEELKKLTEEHRKTREQLGGLSHTVGYILEDRSYVGLPPLLERDFHIKLKEPLRRDWVEVGPGKFLEVNIIGKGERDGQEVWIIGECKTQLKKRDVDEFLRHLKKIEDYLGGESLPVIVTYQTIPPVRRYAEEKGLRVYFSYEMPL